MKSIPPTKAALKEHVKRAVYQGGHVWGQMLFFWNHTTYISEAEICLAIMICGLCNLSLKIYTLFLVYSVFHHYITLSSDFVSYYLVHPLSHLLAVCKLSSYHSIIIIFTSTFCLFPQFRQLALWIILILVLITRGGPVEAMFTPIWINLKTRQEKLLYFILLCACGVSFLLARTEDNHLGAMWV